ncbi:hypothetical protein AB0425_39800 [Actinosynnema sp. NPDC051121]
MAHQGELREELPAFVTGPAAVAALTTAGAGAALAGSNVDG